MPALHKLLEAIAALPVLTWLTLNVIAPLDRRLLLATQGRLSLTGTSTILLVSRGARSGRLRYVSLPGLYLDDGSGSLVVLASKGGADHHPAWYHNIKHDPKVEVITRGQRIAYTAQDTSGDTRDALWSFLLERWSGFAAYEKKAYPRIIPVVLLKRKQD